jgi:hypothetical protein
MTRSLPGSLAAVLLTAGVAFALESSDPGAHHNRPVIRNASGWREMPLSATPDPGTLLLVGSLVAGVGVAVRRRAAGRGKGDLHRSG